MKSYVRSFLIFAGCLIVGCNTCDIQCQAEDWPAIRGSSSQGIVVGSGKFDSSGIKLKTRWKKKIGSGYSSVVVVGDRAYTMFTSGDSDIVGCFDTENGSNVWEYRIDEKFKGANGSFDGPISTPLIFDGHLYGLSCQGRFVCLDGATGELIWEKSLTKDFRSKMPLYGFATSPIAAGGNVVLQVGAPEKMLVAFDPKTGIENWACGDDRIDSQSPSLIDVDGEQVLLATGKKTLLGVDAESGNVRFVFDHDAGNGSAMIPVDIGNETVLLTLDDSFSKAVKLTTAENRAIETSEAWQERSIKNTYNIPTLCNGNLFGFSTRILTCVDPSTGKPHWKSRKPGDGFLIVVDGHLIIVTKEGGVHIATATADNYNEVVKLDLFEDLVWTVPSFSDGAIFIRSLAEIACVDIVADVQPAAELADNITLPLATGFQELLKRVEEANDDASRKKIADEYLNSQSSFPIVDSGIAHFVYYGPENDVALACDVFGARQERKMVAVDGTDVKYYSLQLEKDQRVNYAFLVDFKPQLDKLNPRKMTSSMYAGEMEFAVRLRNDAPLQMSWFGMQDWKEPDFLKSLPEKLNGQVVERQLKSDDEDGTALSLDVYLPPGYTTELDKRYPVVYVFPAPGMASGQFVETADHLFASEAVGLRPAILVIPEGRTQPKTEDRLVPFIDAEFRTIADRNSRSLVGFGFSAGSAFGALGNRPDWFGAISVQSPLVFDTKSALEPIGKLTEKTRVYLDWGRFDMHNPVENWDLRRSSKEIFDSIGEREQVILSGGMVNDSVDWASWRNRFDQVLKVLTME